MSSNIEVVDLDYYQEDENICLDAKEVWIDFLSWHIVVSIKDGDHSKAAEEITIIAKVGGESTKDFFVFKDVKGKKVSINPTGMNLYQVMDILLTNYKKEQERLENVKD